MAAHEGQKAEGGGEQLPQSQPEGLQYLLPPDAAGNNAAALAALLQANQATWGGCRVLEAASRPAGRLRSGPSSTGCKCCKSSPHPRGTAHTTLQSLVHSIIG